MKRAISLLFRLLRIQIRSQLEYPTAFIMEVISSTFILGFYFVAFALTFTRFDEIGGWTLGEIAFIWGLAEFSFGTMDMLFSGFDYDAFGPLVKRGRFDQLLLRPVNITLQVLGSRFVMRRLGKMAEGLIIFLFGLSLINIPWTPLKIIYLPLLAISQIMFFGALFIMGATTTFWTTERLEILNAFTYGGNEVMSYPMHIFQKPIRWIFTYLVPVIFMSYFPAVYLLEKPDPFNAPSIFYFLAPLVAIGMFYLAMRFWHFGIRNYQSTGS
jgi:ABC-2 type transport system permease protein